MKELVILSGKGGTGKTSLAGCLGLLSGQSVLVDCDVDASNLHLIMKTEVRQEHEFVSGRKARLDSEACTACGICEDYCRFGAVEKQDGLFRIDDIACEGCGVCVHVCPENAVSLVDNLAGRWFESTSPHGPFVHGELGIGQGNSGKLVSVLRRRAREIAREKDLPLTIVDGPPGIGCPVIASLTGADYALIVTEPSPSARHDMNRLIKLAEHFHVRTGICVNKYNLNDEVTASIEREARELGADVIGRIGFDPAVTQAQKKATTVLENGGGRTADEIRAIWEKLRPQITVSTDQPAPNECVGCPWLSVRPPDIGGGEK